MLVHRLCSSSRTLQTTRRVSTLPCRIRTTTRRSYTGRSATSAVWGQISCQPKWGISSARGGGASRTSSTTNSELRVCPIGVWPPSHLRSQAFHFHQHYCLYTNLFCICIFRRCIICAVLHLFHQYQISCLSYFLIFLIRMTFHFQTWGCSNNACLAGEVEHVFRDFLMRMVSHTYFYERLCGLSWLGYLVLDLYEAIITGEMVATQQYALDLPCILQWVLIPLLILSLSLLLPQPLLVSSLTIGAISIFHHTITNCYYHHYYHTSCISITNSSTSTTTTTRVLARRFVSSIFTNSTTSSFISSINYSISVAFVRLSLRNGFSLYSLLLLPMVSASTSITIMIFRIIWPSVFFFSNSNIISIKNCFY